MYKRPFALLLIVVLIVGCGGSKELKQELDVVKQETQGTDSVLVVLDARLKEFQQEVKAMRETYNENHISLENLYKMNAESKKNIEALSSELEVKLADERSRTDSVQTISAQANEEQIEGLKAEQVQMRETISGLNSSIQSTQFQVDSIFATMDPEKMAVLEENLLAIANQFSLLDSSFSEFQLTVADHMMRSEEQLGTLELNARVQDSSNYDILSQLVFLENKIISLTNSFNELMAMPSTTPTIVRTPVSQSPITPVQQPMATKMDYETYKQNYIDALSSYQNGDFMGAIDAFELLIRNDSENDYADNAQYWIGESYYALDEYSKAIEAFRKVQQFKDSNKADAAQFKIGYSYLNAGDKARGYNELERLLDMYPDSSYRDKVKQILASR